MPACLRKGDGFYTSHSLSQLKKASSVFQVTLPSDFGVSRGTARLSPTGHPVHADAIMQRHSNRRIDMTTSNRLDDTSLDSVVGGSVAHPKPFPLPFPFPHPLPLPFPFPLPLPKPHFPL
jgi:hypothetical protein